MRKLRVVRKKSFVGSLNKARVFVKTGLEGDLKLGDVNLKLLGVLKNGQVLDAEVADDNVEIYVVYDKFFPDRFHTKYSLEDGEEDVRLYTWPVLSPFSGNPFVISRKTSLTNHEKRVVKKAPASNQQSTGKKALYYAIMLLFAVLGYIFGMSIV